MEENEEKQRSTAGLTAEEIGGLRVMLEDKSRLWGDHQAACDAREPSRFTLYDEAKMADARVSDALSRLADTLLSSSEEAQGLRDQVETLYGEIGGLHCEIEVLGEERRGLRDRVASLERALDEARSIASLGSY